VPVWSFPFHYHAVQALGVCGFAYMPLLWSDFKSQPPVGKRAVAAVGFCVLHVLVCAASYWPPFLPGIAVELGLWVVAVLLLRMWWPGRGERMAPGDLRPVGDAVG
jgi:peptidoglycan/LPS O-acetylase OafA/YrhL